MQLITLALQLHHVPCCPALLLPSCNCTDLRALDLHCLLDAANCLALYCVCLMQVAALHVLQHKMPGFVTASCRHNTHAASCLLPEHMPASTAAVPCQLVLGLQIKFKQPTPAETPLVVRSQIVNMELRSGPGRRATVRVQLSLYRPDAGGKETLLASAEGVYKKLASLRAM